MARWRPRRLTVPKKFRPSASTWLALASLGISLFSLPVLQQHYFRPDLVVSGPPSFLADSKVFFMIQEYKGEPKSLAASYSVTNIGNAAATKIEIGFLVRRAAQRHDYAPHRGQHRV